MNVESIKAVQMFDLAESQRFRCALTGLKMSSATARIDHIIPVARGGDHLLSNAHVVLQEINTMKGQYLPDEFLGLCALVVAQASSEDVGRATGVARAAFESDDALPA